jgi:uncharacterized protein (TIGR02118 family)
VRPPWSRELRAPKFRRLSTRLSLCEEFRSPPTLCWVNAVSPHGFHILSFIYRCPIGKDNKGRNKMARLVVMYKTPKDPAAFDKYYAATHIPLAKKIPGLRKYEISRGPVATPSGPSGFHLIATLHFDDLTALQKGLGSPEGQAAAGDVPNFATGGADLIMFDSKDA